MRLTGLTVRLYVLLVSRLFIYYMIRATVCRYFVRNFQFTIESLSLFRGIFCKFHIFVHSNTSNALLVILLFTWKWKLESKPLNNDRLSLVKTKLPIKKISTVVALILLPFNITIILRLKGLLKRRLIGSISRIFLKIYRAV